MEENKIMERIGKSQIIKRIHKAAISYKQYFLGYTYMFVYDNQFVEVRFKKSSFLHLTGVDTKLSAEDFFAHAVKKINCDHQKFYFLQTTHIVWLFKKQLVWTICIS